MGFREVFVWHTPNQRALSGLVWSVFGPKRAGGIMGRLTTWLKRLGFKSGFPTSASPCPGRRVIFVEAKNVDGELSDNQVDVHAALRARGFCRVDMPDCR